MVEGGKKIAKRAEGKMREGIGEMPFRPRGKRLTKMCECSYTVLQVTSKDCQLLVLP